MNMFYSQCLISKKGPLRNVWIAAHFHKKLKKEQVNLTNISSSVDKILVDVPVVTYRILGYLLLGIVRIYSKKVEYLEHDCRSVMTEISDFSVSKKATAPPVEVMGIPYYSSITLPATFELDAFDLEVSDYASGEHMKSRTDITLEGKNDGVRTYSFAKYPYEEDGAQFEDYSAHAHGTHSLYLDDTMIKGSYNLSNMEPSMEKLRDYRFSLEERFDPMILGEPEEEEDNVRPFNDINETNGKQIKSSGFGNVFGDDPKKAKFSEVTSLENEELQTTSEKRPMSITIDVTPKSKVPNASGATSPEFMAVRTPAAKDRSRVLKKQKIVFDEDRVIPGKEYKRWLDESSDLVRERKKAPSALQCQKARQISNLPRSLFEPLIPCTFSDHRNLICQKKKNSPEPVENVETTSKTDGLESPRIHRSPDPESSIAPPTPVTQSTSLRYSEMRSSNIFDKEGPSMSFQSTEKDSQDFDLSFINEELSSCEGNSVEKRKWSVKTRAVANYLHKNFLTRRKKREDEELNLSQVLKGRTKRESARLFYEILVLKNGGYIDVKQENAYDEIVVVETHKLKKACES